MEHSMTACGIALVLFGLFGLAVGVCFGRWSARVDEAEKGGDID